MPLAVAAWILPPPSSIIIMLHFILHFAYKTFSLFLLEIWFVVEWDKEGTLSEKVDGDNHSVGDDVQVKSGSHEERYYMQMQPPCINQQHADWLLVIQFTTAM